MRIASVTVAFDDFHKIDNWKKYYAVYHNEIDTHIIVDNGSSEEFRTLVESEFPDSVILHRADNGGVTAAYNLGIKYALQDSGIEAILLIDADIKLEQGAISELYKCLSNGNAGFAAPILLRKDSNIVENYGCQITNGLVYVQSDAGKQLTDVADDSRFVDGVPGGMNMGSRKLYTSIGYEDEKLFMYADELDMAIRARKAGFKLCATKKAIAWHQHANFNGKSIRLPYVAYLSARNVLYIAKKHYGTRKAVSIFVVRFFKAVAWLFAKIVKLQFNQIKYPWYSIVGLVNGIRGDMSKNKYSVPFAIE